MTRTEKQELVKQFSETYASYPCMIVVRQTRLNAAAVAQLRKEAREAGVIFKIVKNKLAKRALSHHSEAIHHAFSGPTGVFLSQDPVALAKLISTFSKKREENFFPLAGMLNGAALKDKDVSRLATLPSLDQLRAQILSLINTPAIRLLSVINDPARRVAGVMHSYSQKQ